MKIEQEVLFSKKPRIHLLNTEIDALTMDETVELIKQYIKTDTPLHLMGVNADKINEVNDNDLMREIVNSCGIINADGASVVLASKFLGKPVPERVAGVDLMLRLCEECSKSGDSIYLLGAKQNVVEETETALLKKYPGLRILGIHNGYFRDEEWDWIAQELKQLKPAVVFVGISSPKKEYLIEHLQQQGVTSVLMGVGGSFDVISGNIPRAPLWMQKMCLEWLFRMIQEPKRLLKRYIVGNTRFIFAVFKEKLGR